MIYLPQVMPLVKIPRKNVLVEIERTPGKFAMLEKEKVEELVEKLNSTRFTTLIEKIAEEDCIVMEGFGNDGSVQDREEVCEGVEDGIELLVEGEE